MKIDLTKEEIIKANKCYDRWLKKPQPPYQQDENIFKIMSQAKKRGYMTKDDLVAVAEWKAIRNRGRCKKNSDTTIKQMSKIAFAPDCDEAVRITILQTINGVRWAMASVILHFAFPKKYPILDIRAMTTIGGVTNRIYSFDIWWEYTLLCREAAKKHNITLRELDRALWIIGGQIIDGQRK